MALRRLAAPGAAAAAALCYDSDSGLCRAARTLGYGLLIGCDYKLGPASRQPAGSAEYKAALSATHERSARRLLALCQTHLGLYNKLGQYLSSMTIALPHEYTSVLAACQDRACSIPLSQVRTMIEAELGRPLETLFSSFGTEPVAAASLAQVHRAVTADTGEEVAVKVQYPRVARQMSSDLTTFRQLAKLVGWAFPDYGYGWIIEDFDAVALQELDFRLEAANAAKCASFFADWPRVHVPRTLPHLSTERVLTMEWIDGAKLDDPRALAAIGVRSADVAPLLTSAFAAMVFEHGFVHCDPHAGNLLARPMPTDNIGGHRRGQGHNQGAAAGGAQLVLLDHGMYRTLSEEYRRNYAELWVSLLAQDHAAGRAAAAALGIPPEDYEVLAIVLTFRPPTSRTPIGVAMSAAERAVLRQRYASVSASDVNAFLERLPREMLMVMRTWGLVRSLNRALGGTTRQRFLTMASYAVRGAMIHSRDSSMDGSGAAWRLPFRMLAAFVSSVWCGIAIWVAIARMRAQVSLELCVARMLHAGELARGTDGLLAPGVKQFG
mgnify:CR=1 FL=1